MNLIVDNHKTAGNSATDALAKFMSGEKVALDADFKEEDHPRGGEGRDKGKAEFSKELGDSPQGQGLHSSHYYTGD